MNIGAYLQFILQITHANRGDATKVYSDYKQPFSDAIEGALTKELLVRDEDMQVLHRFDSAESTIVYLSSHLLQVDVFRGLKPLWSIDFEVKTYINVYGKDPAISAESSFLYGWKWVSMRLY